MGMIKQIEFIDLPKSDYRLIKDFYLRNQLERAMFCMRYQIIPKWLNLRVPWKCHNIRCSEMIEVL